MPRELSVEVTSPDGSQTVGSFDEAARAGFPIGCQWFAGCEKVAAVALSHPVLTAVPTCRSCADKIASLA